MDSATTRSLTARANTWRTNRAYSLNVEFRSFGLRPDSQSSNSPVLTALTRPKAEAERIPEGLENGPTRRSGFGVELVEVRFVKPEEFLHAHFGALKIDLFGLFQFVFQAPSGEFAIGGPEASLNLLAGLPKAGIVNPVR
ncbi:MAG: hypothetical protein AB9869_36255 [Verrucomicrobiia bacterium]